MTSDGNLNLDTFIARVYAIDFVGTGPREAHESRVAVIRIVQHMWELMEASQRALARAMRENRIHAECLDTALTHIESICRSSPHYYGGACEVAQTIRAKLAELETQP